jgi:23S rRNA (pseudouridine1915-N3)-methyltransferase
LRITLLCIGKVREPWLQAGCDEYLKRLRPRLPVEIVEIKDKDADAQRILDKVPPRHALWVLDERGKQPTSTELASLLSQVMGSGLSGVVLLIGGPNGVPPEVLSRAHERLSLSRLTLPHRLVRLIVLEQLYRAVSILRGEPYHRE